MNWRNEYGKRCIWEGKEWRIVEIRRTIFGTFYRLQSEGGQALVNKDEVALLNESDIDDFW